MEMLYTVVEPMLAQEGVTPEMVNRCQPIAALSVIAATYPGNSGHFRTGDVLKTHYRKVNPENGEFRSDVGRRQSLHDKDIPDASKILALLADEGVDNPHMFQANGIKGAGAAYIIRQLSEQEVAQVVRTFSLDPAYMQSVSADINTERATAKRTNRTIYSKDVLQKMAYTRRSLLLRMMFEHSGLTFDRQELMGSQYGEELRNSGFAVESSILSTDFRLLGSLLPENAEPLVELIRGKNRGEIVYSVRDIGQEEFEELQTGLLRERSPRERSASSMVTRGETSKGKLQKRTKERRGPSGTTVKSSTAGIPPNRDSLTQPRRLERKKLRFGNRGTTRLKDDDEI